MNTDGQYVNIPSQLDTHPCVLLRKKMDMMAHTCNPANLEMKAGGSEVKGHPFLRIELSPAWATGKPVSINQTIFNFPKEVSGLQQKSEGI